MSVNDSPVWFITGCSTGIGRELATLVLNRGWRAVVTARDPKKVTDIIAGHEDRALALPLDVTDATQVSDALKRTEDAFGRIDVLVNNAGYGYLAAVEEGEDDAIRDMFETNFFALAALTRAVLPGMRARRSGHIVNISSIGGLTAFGATGYYHATKFAVEGLSESLALEVAPLGIKVIIVEPGPFRTNWAGASIKESPIRIEDYEQTAGKRRESTQSSSGNQAGDPVRASEAIITAVQSDNPPLHLLLGKRAFDAAAEKLDALHRDFDTWKELTLATDYPAS